MSDKKDMNKFENYKDIHKENSNVYLYKDIVIDIQDMNINTCTNIFNKKENKLEYILSKLSNRIFARSNVMPIEGDALMELNVHLPRVFASLNEFQINMLLETLSGNLSEQIFLLTQPAIETFKEYTKKVVSYEENFPLKINLRIDQIELSLFSGGGDQKIKELTSLCGESLVISLLNFPDDSSEVMLNLKTLSLYDKAGGEENKFPKFVETINVDPENPDQQVIKIFFSETQNLDTFIQVYIGNVRGNLVPQGVWNLMQLLLPKLVLISPSMDQFKKIQKKTKAKKITNKGATFIDLHIDNPQLAILEDSTVKETRAIILNCNFNLLYEESIVMNKTININLSSIELFKCVLNDPKSKKLCILENFNISLTHHSINREIDRVHVFIDKMKFSVARQDYVLIKFLKEKWEKVIKEKPIKLPEKKNTKVINLENSPNFVKSFFINFEGISARLIDDSYGHTASILSIRMLKSKAEIILSSEIYNILSAKAKFELFVDCFNVNKQSWEPM